MSKTIENLKTGNYEVVDNQGLSVTAHFIECLEKEFADLEAKLAKSDAEIERLKEINAVQKNKIINIDKMYKQSQEEQKQLKQQLAEKEDLLKTYTQLNKDLTKRLDDRCDICIERHKQSQNQTAIDELEKLLEKTQTLDVMVQSGHYINQKKVNVVFKDVIDQQIKSLKGEK